MDGRMDEERETLSVEGKVSLTLQENLQLDIKESMLRGLKPTLQQSLGLRRWRSTSTALQRLQRHDPRRHARREALGVQGSEQRHLVLLDVRDDQSFSSV